jgi:microcystin-dependent protein
MAEPFLSEIRLMSFVYAPKGWALCNGQLLPINQNQPLFSLLGTTFGGDGRVNFALPDLRGRTPIHVGSGHTLGERGGEQAHTLSIAELPTHTHVLSGSSLPNGNAANPHPVSGGTLLAADPGNAYAAAIAGASVPLAAGTISNTGGSQAHLNMQPFLTVSFCIALQGIFPSPN